MLKVLYCTHTSVQVSETFLRKTRDYLATKFDILVLSTSQKGKDHQSLPSHFLGIRDESLFHRVAYNALSILLKKAREEVRLKIHRWLVRRFFKSKNITANAAIIEYGTSAFVFAPVLIEKNIPFVITFHGYDCSMYLGFPWYRSEIIELCKSSIAVVVPSHHLRRRLQLIGVPGEKITTEPCAPQYSDLPQTDSSAESNVVALGRLTEKKCPEALVYAARLVVQEFPKVQFHIIGDGPLRERVKCLIDDFDLAENVTLHGALKHKAALALLSQGTVFIQHSVTSSLGDQEGFPVAIAEALGMGIPVVSTYHSGITEAISPGESGLLVQEHDFEDMAKNICALLADKKLRSKLGEKGKEKIIKTARDLSREKKLATLIELRRKR